MSESVMEIDGMGHKYWRNSKGQFHRTDGPAFEYSNGYKAWYIKGRFHRINGPAIEDPYGPNMWCVNGECLGYGATGFWTLWDTLTPEQKKDPTLLSYLPGGFGV
jgi:hypothetical protein